MGGRSYSIAKWWYQVKERDRELRKEIESRGEREREGETTRKRGGNDEEKGPPASMAQLRSTAEGRVEERGRGKRERERKN